jgi:CheY-like chemotaxis protein
MEHCILFVDDERNVLSSLKRMLIDEEYATVFANSGEEGLQMLEEHPVTVIVSDMRMPVMNGVEFLKRAQVIRPDAVRIVLSGFSEVGDLREVINQGGVWRYIAKPWDDYEMKMTLRNAMELYDTATERTRLHEELAHSNAQLAQLNAELEQLVAERTRQLEVRNAILNLILDDVPVGQIGRYCCEQTMLLVPAVTVSLVSPQLPGSVSAGGALEESRLSALHQQTLEAEEQVVVERAVCMPLKKLDERLGTLVLKAEPDLTGSQLDVVRQTIVPLLSMALSNSKMLDDAPQLLSDIDEMIDTL